MIFYRPILSFHI